MSDTDAAPRPRQLTTSAGFVIGGSLLLVFAVFDAMGKLQSVDVRDSVSQALDSTSGLRLSVDEVIAIMRVGLNIAGVCAAAAVVLGIFVLQRHRGARTALGVLAVPILLTAPLTGSILGALVAAAIAMLWSQQARDWFAGRAPAPTPAPASPHPPVAPPRPEEQERRAPAYAPSTSTTSPAQPPATSGYGETRVGATPPAPTPDAAPVFTDPRWAPPPAYPLPPQRIPTPPGVRAACLVTWVAASAVAVVCLLALAVAVGNSDVYLSELEKNPAVVQAGFTPGALLALLWVVGLGLVAWAAGAAVLAFFVWRRHDWARYLLLLSTAAVFVAAFFAFPVGLPLQVACVVTSALLVNRQAREWFSGRQLTDRQLW